MTEEQIDEIAMRVAEQLGWSLDACEKSDMCIYAHALLAELAKVNEPAGFIAHNQGGFYEGSHIPAAPYDYAKFHNGLPTAGTKLFTHPLPQPDLVAEIDQLKSDLENERIRLAACGVAALGYFEGCNDEYKSASLSDTLSLYAANTELRQQLATAQAINTHKARKEKV